MTEDSTRRRQQLAQLDHRDLVEYALSLEAALFSDEIAILNERATGPGPFERCEDAFEQGEILAFANGDYDG